MFKRSAPKVQTEKSKTGQAGEDRALPHLQQQGLRLVERNYRGAAGPGAGRAR
jgi:putative endonuclease